MESGCTTKCTAEDTSENDNRKLTDLATLGTVIMMRECKWRKADVRLTFSPFSDFYYKAGIVTEEMILAAVARGTLFGIIEIDIFTPTEVKRRLQEINFPVIFCRVETSKDMLSEAMQTLCESYRMKFPRPPQLSLRYSAKNHMTTTETLRFYLELGLRVTKVHRIIEYQRSRPLEKFVKLSNNYIAL